MSNKETPISKYLATLERRQAQMNNIFGIATGSPSPSPTSRNPMNIRQRLRFDDETFLQPHDHPAPLASSGRMFRSSSGLDLAGSTSITNLVERREHDASLNRSGVKRKRFSFENSFKEEEETAKKMAELEKLLRQTQAELIESRALTTKLEQQKMELTRNHAEKIIQFEKSHNEMRMKTREAVEMAEECKNKLDKKVKELEEKNNKYHKEFTERAEKVASLEQKSIELESENMQLKSKLHEIKSGHSKALNKSNSELEETEKGAEKWIMDCQILQGQLELKDKLIAKYQEELKEAQAQSITKTPKRTVNAANEIVSDVIDIEGNTVTIPSPTVDKNTIERMETLENMFAKQQMENNKLSESVQKLSKENNLMRSSINKEMLLQEEIITLENEVKLLRDLLKKKADVEVVRDSLKDQVDSWISVASQVDQGNATPQNLENFIKQTQQSLIEFKHENASLTLRLSTMNTTLSTCQKELTSSKNKLKLVDDLNNKLNSDMKQLSHKLMLVTKDRDGLKCLNESYGQELENVISSALTKRIVELEELVREYEVIVNEDPSAKKSCRECETRMKLVSDLKNELDKLKSEKESYLTNTTFADESGLNTTGVKVVTFGMNPSTLTLEGRIQELISENKKLSDRIKYLEDQSIGGLGDSFIVEEKNNLVKELAEVNRKYDALREDYNFELHQNQVVMTKLFGFNVTFVKDTSAQIRLQSIYSPNVEDFFVFQENENEMMLMETAVLAQYRAEIEKYLVTEGSIPAFLSYITISLASGLVTQPVEGEESSTLPTSQGSQGQESCEDETMNTIEVQPSGRKTVQVEIEGESDNDDGSEGDPEEEAEEEEEEYDEDDREDYSESDGESEDDGHDKNRGRVKRRDSDSDDVVCIDSD